MPARYDDEDEDDDRVRPGPPRGGRRPAPDDDEDDDIDHRLRRARTPGNENIAIAALVVGILGMVAWCLPICGAPVNIAGIVLGSLAVKNTASKGMAITGLVLSVLGMLLTLVNAAVGVYMAVNNKQF